MPNTAFLTSIAAFLGSIVALTVALGGVMLWAVHLRRRLTQARLDTTAFATVLSSTNNACYRIEGGNGTRLGNDALPSSWPRDLSALLASAPGDERQALDKDLVRLSASGTAFMRAVHLRLGEDRLVQFSGCRMSPGAAHGGADETLDLVWVSDISDQVLADQRHSRLMEQLDQQSETIDMLPIAVWWRDSSGRVVGGNRKYQELPQTAMLADPLVNSVLEHGGTQSRTGTVRPPSGVPLPLLLMEMPLRGGTLGLAFDRQEAEASRAEIGRLILGHREVMEAVSTGIVIYGPEGHMIFSNSAFSTLWGLDYDFLLSEPTLSQVLDTLRAQRILPEYADYRAFKQEQLAQFRDLVDPVENLLHLPDGRTIRTKTARHPFGGLTFVYDDVTDELELASSLNTLMEVQRMTLDNLVEGVAVFGADGRLRLWNKAFSQMWAVPVEDLSRQPHIAWLIDAARPLADHGADWPGIRAGLIEQVTAHAQAQAHSRMELTDGRVLEVNALPLPDGNVLMSYQDITDGIKVQRALEERNEALEASSQLKSEFIANVSYELRTPLNAIIGFSEILTHEYFGALNPRQIEYSRGILNSSHRLMSLIDNILDLATMQAGQMVLELTAVDVCKLLEDVASRTREWAGRYEIGVTFDCPSGFGFVRGDEKRLRQALMNLVSNAIKFTRAGGMVTIAGVAENGWLGLRVGDDGIGIPKTDQARVFERFERLSGQRGENTGAGLGLALVKGFIEMHGGRVELWSEPKKGTKVTCWLKGLTNETQKIVPFDPAALDRKTAASLGFGDDLRARS
ncbi:MAG TPA: PAS-domain containing protein [Stellaceae bacterium]|jgi:signal transduction histidine kinase|nr:PAS-domain containing protein [Stellaceae bacterium]